MASPTPSTRWFRNRKLRYAVILVGLIVGGHFCHDWLFVAEDLRRMHGVWKLVRFEVDGRESADIRPDMFTFVGDRLTTSHDWSWQEAVIQLEPAERKFRLYRRTDCERSILGTKWTMPLWLIQPGSYMHGAYEFNGDEMAFWIKGFSDTPEGVSNKFYLKRQ